MFSDKLEMNFQATFNDHRLREKRLVLLFKILLTVFIEI